MILQLQRRQFLCCLSLSHRWLHCMKYAVQFLIMSNLAQSYLRVPGLHLFWEWRRMQRESRGKAHYWIFVMVYENSIKEMHHFSLYSFSRLNMTSSSSDNQEDSTTWDPVVSFFAFILHLVTLWIGDKFAEFIQANVLFSLVLLRKELQKRMKKIMNLSLMYTLHQIKGIRKTVHPMQKPGRKSSKLI